MKSHWGLTAQLVLVAMICAGAVLFVFDVTPASGPIAKPGAGIDINASTVRDQDDADSVFRGAEKKAAAIDLKDLEILTEVLEKEADDTIRAACPDGDCTPPMAVARRQGN